MNSQPAIGARVKFKLSQEKRGVLVEVPHTGVVLKPSRLFPDEKVVIRCDKTGSHVSIRLSTVELSA